VPIYEFRCNSCRRRTSLFTRSISAAVSGTCQHCGSGDLSRLFSRVAVLRSEGDVDSGLDESSLAGVDENDPRSIARWVRKMSREMGEPLDGEMVSELERMEAGEMPEDYPDGESGGLEEDFGDVD
jgi:putative FmdB family regulatory protein